MATVDILRWSIPTVGLFPKVSLLFRLIVVGLQCAAVQGVTINRLFTTTDTFFYTIDPKIITYKKLIIFTKQLFKN